MTVGRRDYLNSAYFQSALFVDIVLDALKILRTAENVIIQLSLSDDSLP